MAGADDVLSFAVAQLGDPYVFGTAGDDRFDCSGLTLAAFATIGVKLPHKASYQQELGMEVGLSGAMPGDLVFFRGGPTAVTNSNGLNIGHVGIYVGNGMVLEAPRTGDNVRIRPIGNRADRVVSVKRYTTPSSAPIVVPPSPWNGMHGSPETGGQAYVIPAGLPGAGQFGDPSVEVPPSQPTESPWYPGGQAPTGAQLPQFGAQLNATQLAQVAYAAGFRGDDLAIAVAIAMGESGGRATALNPNGEHSVGLWQINMDAHGSRFGDEQALYDPYVNAQAAFALYQSSGFKPWTVYTRNIYKDHLAEATGAVNQSMADGTIALSYSNPGGQVPSYEDPWSGVGGLAVSADPAEMARQLYGYLAAYLDHPEIGPILSEAAAGGWSQSRLEGALMQTQWWQETGAAKRQWDAAVAQDPKTAQEQVDARTAEIYDLAQSMGVDLKAIEFEGRGNTAMHLAQLSLEFGWSSTQLQDAIGAEILRDPTLGQQVREGTVGRQIRTAAADYGVPLSDSTLDKYSRQIAAGTSTMDDFQTYLVKQAKAQYGELGGALDRGETVRQVADPYLQIAGQMLGVDPEQMKLNDPKWMAPLTFVDEKGVKRQMNYDEWMAKLRSDGTYGYGSTDIAMDKARQFAQAIGGAYGKVAA